MQIQVRLTAFVSLLAAIFTVAALAADINGKWTAQVPTRGGQMRETTFNFKVDGDKLTGTVSGPRGDIPITDGKVSGDEISFVVTYSFGGNDVRILHKGKISGDEIKFTRQREGADQTQEFTAKRATS